MASIQWSCKTEKPLKKPIPSITALTHPLKPPSFVLPSKKVVKTGMNKKSAEVLLDPLSQMALEQSSNGRIKVSDSKSSLIVDCSVDQKLSKVADFGPLDISSLSGEVKKCQTVKSSVEPWEIQRQSILLNYTTAEKLSLLTSFLPGGTAIPQPTLTEKTANKLEQLDQSDATDMRQMSNLSQSDYIEKISDLQKALKVAWDSDQRVMSIRLVIQCAKLLADTSVAQFYPSKFVLITDVLDTFGQLVFDRLVAKSNANLPAGRELDPARFTCAQVPDGAKETCRNWMFKVSSIRELLPRLYVESAILKSLRFVSPDAHISALKRLCLMTRGLGDPLVANFARCHLCKIAAQLDPVNVGHPQMCFDDFLTSYGQPKGKLMASRSYLHSLSPSVEWILRCYANLAGDDLFESILARCRPLRSQILLQAAMVSFNPDLVASRAVELIQLIREIGDVPGGADTSLNGRHQGETNLNSPRAALLRTLGFQLVLSRLDRVDLDLLKVLNDAWKLIMRLSNPRDYAICAAVWMDFAAKNFGPQEIDTLLKDVVSHVTPDRAFEQLYPQLKDILEKILSHQKDFASLLGMRNFPDFLELFQSESVRCWAAKTLLDGFVRSTTVESCVDLRVAGECLSLGKTLLDRLDSLSSAEEWSCAADLICSVLDRFRLESDYDGQLQLYAEARGNFSGCDRIVEYLVGKVNLLAIRLLNDSGVKRRQTAGLSRAFVAFSYISIPSIGGDIFTRLQLYLEAAQVALISGCLAQTDAMCKSAISLLLEVPIEQKLGKKLLSTEGRLLPHINNFLSFLLLVPDSPDLEVLYLLKGLINAVKKYPWPDQSDGKMSVWLSILSWLQTASQPEFPYRIDGVESNATLYGGNADFLAELQSIGDSLLAEVISQIRLLGDKRELRRQSIVSLNLADLILHRGDLNSDPICRLFISLIKLVGKNGQSETKSRLNNTRSYVDWMAQRGSVAFQLIRDHI